jgi:hypothetical protein
VAGQVAAQMRLDLVSAYSQRGNMSTNLKEFLLITPSIISFSLE